MDMEHSGAMEGKMQWKQMKAVRVLTAVIVLIFVFWCGFQLGEIKGVIGNHERGSCGVMMGGGWGGGNIEYRTTSIPPMMQGTFNASVPSPTKGATVPAQ